MCVCVVFVAHTHIHRVSEDDIAPRPEMDGRDRLLLHLKRVSWEAAHMLVQVVVIAASSSSLYLYHILQLSARPPETLLPLCNVFVRVGWMCVVCV